MYLKLSNTTTTVKVLLSGMPLNGFPLSASRYQNPGARIVSESLCEGFRVNNLTILGNTVFIRLNAAAFIKFSAFPMRRLFEGDVYFEITFLKSLTTVTGNSL